MEEYRQFINDNLGVMTFAFLFLSWIAAKVIAYVIPIGKYWTALFSFLMIFITFLIGVVGTVFIIMHVYGWRKFLSIIYSEPISSIALFSELAVANTVVAIPISILTFLYFRHKR